ncbi:MAG: hypothetical protein HRU44_03190 [Candidatus Thalassarchaeum sp.]|nr:hypothetical protein [Candidatus Thalassarchaeum sp.]
MGERGGQHSAACNGLCAYVLAALVSDGEYSQGEHGGSQQAWRPPQAQS